MLILLGAAWAEPVVVVGDRPAPQGLEVVSLDDLSPVLPGTPCAGPPATLEELDAVLVEADRELAYAHTDEAAALLDQASRMRTCLVEVATPETLSRGDFLRGILELLACPEAGACEAAATEHFVAALTVHPGLQADQNYELSGAFSAAQSVVAAAPRSPVEVLPAGAAVRIDGREAAQLPPGEHLVQVQQGASWQSWQVTTEGPLLLVVPSAIAPEALGDPGSTEAGRALGLAFGEQRGWLVSEAGTWTWTGEAWLAVEPERPPLQATTLMELGGAGVAAAGLVTGVVGTSVGLVAKRNAEDPSRWSSTSTAQDWTTHYEAAEPRVHAANQVQRVGYAAFGVGLAVAGVGRVLDTDAVLVGPGVVELRW